MSEVDSKLFNHPILITGGAGFLGSDYQLEKSFLKNNQGIFIFKKLAYVQ